MAKQPWQQKKNKTTKDKAREKERALKRKEKENEQLFQEKQAKRYRRVSILTICLGIFCLIFQGTSFDQMTGGALDVMSVVCVALSGVFCTAYGRVIKTSGTVYRIIGTVLIAVAIALAVIMFV